MTGRELERHVAQVLRQRDLARRFRVEFVVGPADHAEWWIDLTDVPAPDDRRDVRIVLPSTLDEPHTLSALSHAIERAAMGGLHNGSARRCLLCGNTERFTDERTSSLTPPGWQGTWRCENPACDHVEQVVPV